MVDIIKTYKYTVAVLCVRDAYTNTGILVIQEYTGTGVTRVTGYMDT